MMEKALAVVVVLLGLAMLKMIRDAGLVIYSRVILASQAGGWILIVSEYRPASIAFLSAGLGLVSVAIYLMHRPTLASKRPG